MRRTREVQRVKSHWPKPRIKSIGPLKAVGVAGLAQKEWHSFHGALEERSDACAEAIPTGTCDGLIYRDHHIPESMTGGFTSTTLTDAAPFCGSWY